MKKNLTPTIFWLQVFVFLFILTEFFIPAIRELFRGSLLFLLPMAVFFVLGLALILSVLKEQLTGKLRKFLLLTGISSVGFFVAVLLHNIIYGSLIYFFGQDFWERVGLEDEPVFFLIAIIVCPIAFLVGMIGSIVLIIKKGR